LNPRLRISISQFLNFSISQCLLLVLAGCAARTLHLPSDAGTPFADAVTVHQSISRACAGVNTLTAELGLSGRAGSRRLRGRVIAGFAAPDSMRLEGVAPFGAPAFILAVRGGDATLLLPREDSVLRGAKAEEILGAMTGVSLSTADLLAVLDGCVVPTPVVVSGALHANGWASIVLQNGATLYLERKGADWHLRAARIPGWEIEYPEWSGAFPRAVRLRSAPIATGGTRPPGAAAATVDLTASISQLETNAAVSPDAFTVSVPAKAQKVTLEELRDAGPLRRSE
jgi:hypothetical protein